MQLVKKPTFEGWVEKKSRHLKKWRKRWLVLESGFMFTFKDEQKYDNPTEIIDLREFGNLVTLGHRAKGHMFALTRVIGEGKSSFEFAVAKDDDYEQWRSHIERIIG